MFSNAPKTSAENSSKTTPFFSRDKKEGKTPFFTIQPKLTIGAPNDPFEQEADQKADDVVNQISQKAEESGKIFTPPSTISRFVQREPEETEEDELRLKSENQSPKNDVESTLNAQRGGGSPLDADTKTQMENAFGSDFSNVRIHTQSAAHHMNQSLGSRAFATGNDIFFKAGAYQPQTTDGKRLLAHELTHTIQQNGIKNNVNRALIQGEKIQWRTITWNDFEAEAHSGASHDAAVASNVALDMAENWIRHSLQQTGETDFTVTIHFNRDGISLNPEMDTELSWKQAWLTDDEAAREKLGPNADIAAVRSFILAHEQLHFNITKTAAENHESRAKAVVPNQPYRETITASSFEAAEARAMQILTAKAEEITELIDAVVEEAEAEEGKVQGIYDTDTDHSQNAEVQQQWRENYEDTYAEARDRDLSAPEATADADEHAHEEETEEAETTP